MVEGSGLENRRGGNSSVGSNPTLSAKNWPFLRVSERFLAGSHISSHTGLETVGDSIRTSERESRSGVLAVAAAREAAHVAQRALLRFKYCAWAPECALRGRPDLTAEVRR